jgi:phosphoesterase RecJ-like protein
VIEWGPLLQLFQAHRTFLLSTHIRPDGDGLGSCLALAEVLRGLGKQVRVSVASSLPPRYRFLDPDGTIERFDGKAPQTPTEVLGILDTGTWNQLGDFAAYVRDFPGSRFVIDHHQTQDDLGAVCFVDTNAEATGRLVFELCRFLTDPLPERAASFLFVALAMDTGWFRHSNTTAATFNLAGELVRAGARPDALYERLFEDNTLPRLKLMGLVLDRLQVASAGRVAYTELRRADYAVTGALPQDTEDLVNFTRSLAGVDVGLFFMEQPRGGIKISFRSRGVDVARIAEQFGGGGHRLASGAVIHGTLEDARERVLTAVASALRAGG